MGKNIIPKYIKFRSAQTLKSAITVRNKQNVNWNLSHSIRKLKIFSVKSLHKKNSLKIAFLRRHFIGCYSLLHVDLNLFTETNFSLFHTVKNFVFFKIPLNTFDQLLIVSSALATCYFQVVHGKRENEIIVFKKNLLFPL